MADVIDSDDVDVFSETDKSSDEERELQIINVKSFVLVQFNTKKTSKYYVAKVTETLDYDEYIVTFLRRHGQSFSYPQIPDCATISKQDVVLHLPQPKTSGGTNRTANLLAFSIDLTAYNIC
ncbi:unnamed protein product [Brassicogethes aeneus]|uniref:Uncharacterized protein n=1 Tax=Brassicogethes aeneus TaxID=1431903 RepID=A0A9P0BHB1_BRAAE|nr:unnamed protein product [Brassicogethes aeneus]